MGGRCNPISNDPQAKVRSQTPMRRPLPGPRVGQDTEGRCHGLSCPALLTCLAPALKAEASLHLLPPLTDGSVAWESDLASLSLSGLIRKGGGDHGTPPQLGHARKLMKGDPAWEAVHTAPPQSRVLSQTQHGALSRPPAAGRSELCSPALLTMGSESRPALSSTATAEPCHPPRLPASRRPDAPCTTACPSFQGTVGLK